MNLLIEDDVRPTRTTRNPASAGLEGAIWHLRNCDLLGQLPDEELARLERCAAVRKVPKGGVVYSPRDAGSHLMVLAEGRVKIKDITPEGKETILGFIEEGEVFGELSVLDGDERGEYAEALSASVVVRVPREEVMALLDRRPELTLGITKLIGLRRRRVENRLRNVLFLPARDRMTRLLDELMDAHGEYAEDGTVQLRIKLSHQDLAGLIGLTRETVTVTLGQMQAEGLLRVQRRRLTILEPRRLRDLAADPSLPPKNGL